MSNLYGYSDYNGPLHVKSGTKQRGDRLGCRCDLSEAGDVDRCANEVDPDSDDESSSSLSETNPLQAGFWMEGDSLAPPCGTSILTIHALLEFAQVTAHDVVFDLGCGDGRVCLEAFHKYRCRTVGVEVEEDLVQRARQLLKDYSNDAASPTDGDLADSALPLLLQQDLRDILHLLVDRAQPHGNENEKRLLPGACDLALPLPTVLVTYLLPEAISLLVEPISHLLQLLPRLRVICNTWGLVDLSATDTMHIKEPSGAITTLFLYTSQSLAKP